MTSVSQISLAPGDEVVQQPLDRDRVADLGALQHERRPDPVPVTVMADVSTHLLDQSCEHLPRAYQRALRPIRRRERVLLAGQENAADSCTPNTSHDDPQDDRAQAAGEAPTRRPPARLARP